MLDPQKAAADAGITTRCFASEHQVRIADEVEEAIVIHAGERTRLLSMTSLSALTVDNAPIGSARVDEDGVRFLLEDGSARQFLFTRPHEVDVAALRVALEAR